MTSSFNAAGTLLAVAGLLLAAGLLLHPPESSDPVQMAATIVGSGSWGAVHMALSVGFLLAAAAGIVIASQGRAGSLNPGLWALVAVSSLAFGSVVLLEIDVVPALAFEVQKGAAAETMLFNALNGFVGSVALVALTIFSLALIGVAFYEQRTKQVVPMREASMLGAVAGAAGLIGMFAPIFGMPALAILFLANIAASLYVAYFGYCLRAKK